jgi:hypothetical protein
MNSHGVRVKLAVGMLLCGVVLALAASAAPAAKVDIHGFLLNRFYFDPGTAHFETERIGLQASAPLADDVSGLIEWYYHPWSTTAPWYLESAYVDFKDKVGGRLRVGKGRSYVFGITPTGGMRKTSEYGLVSEVFTQDRVIGLQYNTQPKRGVAWGVGVYDALNLGSRAVADNHVAGLAGNSHLCDRENTDRRALEAAARVTKQFTPALQVGLSVREARLSSNDLAFLRKNFNQAWTSRAKMRYGLDATYRGKNGLISNAEVYLARTSSLDHLAYAILVGYEPKNPNAMKAYVRWGVSDLNLSAADVDPGLPASTDPAYAAAKKLSDELTADQQQLMLSLVQPIRPGVWVELAYIVNGQDTLTPGVKIPHNDVGFVELCAMF